MRANKLWQTWRPLPSCASLPSHNVNVFFSLRSEPCGSLQSIPLDLLAGMDARLAQPQRSCARDSDTLRAIGMNLEHIVTFRP